jgi:hypothetical protein
VTDPTAHWSPSEVDDDGARASYPPDPAPCPTCDGWARHYDINERHHPLCLETRIEAARDASVAGDPSLPSLLAEAAATLQRRRESITAMRALASAVRREHNARLAWLATLPDGACPAPPQALLDAEATTRDALRRVA